MEIGLGLILSAFIAGILMFLAPCTLPILPAYLGFISGVKERDLRAPERAPEARRQLVVNGVAFIVGFSVVFIIFGTLAGLLGQALVPWRIWLSRVGGALVILFGLFLLGVFDIPFLKREKRLTLPSSLKVGKPTSSLVIGGAFAFGWTPCVGPVLGSILLLAGTSGTAPQGALLLAVFSVGLAIPFLLVTVGFSSATRYIKKFSKYLRIVSVIGGIFLILLGLLLATDNFNLTIRYGYQLFEFIDYDRILDYL